MPEPTGMPRILGRIRVRIVGPDDILPGGAITIDMESVPRIADTIWLEELHQAMVVEDVYWPVKLGRRQYDVHEQLTPEIGCSPAGVAGAYAPARFRRITTTEQLDELPERSTVRDRDGEILVLDGGGVWLEPGGSSLTPELPALLIWNPDWSDCV